MQCTWRCEVATRRCAGWKRSVRFVVTSIIPNLGHDRKRCQKPVLITPLRVARTRRTRPDRQRHRCPGDPPKSTQRRRPPAGRAASRLQKRRAILLIARRVLSFSKDQPGGAQLRTCEAQPYRTARVGDRDQQRTPGHERLDGQGTSMNCCDCETAPAPGAIAMTGARARNRRRWPAWVSGAVGVIRRRRPGAGRSSGGLTGSKRCKKPTARWASRLRYRARAGPLPMRSCSGTRWRCTRQRDGGPPPGSSSRKGSPVAVDAAYIGSVVGHDTDAGGLALDRGHPLLDRADGHGDPGAGPGRPGVPSPRRRGNSCGPQPGPRSGWMELREHVRLRPAASTPAGTDRPGPAGPGGSARASTAPDRSIRPSPICCGRSPTSGLRSPWPGGCSACGPGTPAQPRPRTG